MFFFRMYVRLLQYSDNIITVLYHTLIVDIRIYTLGMQIYIYFPSFAAEWIRRWS